MKKQIFPTFEPSAPEATGTYGFLLQHFKNLSISIDELSTVTGENAQTIRNAISQGRYPIRSFRSGPRRRFLLKEVAQYVDQEHELSATLAPRAPRKTLLPPAGEGMSHAVSLKRGRGRPRKEDVVARQSSLKTGA